MGEAETIIARAIRNTDALGNGMDIEDTLVFGGCDAEATAKAAAESILIALDAAGFQVVPKVPTDGMKVAGGVAFEDSAFGEGELIFDAAGHLYAAMLAASAAQPQPT